MRGVGTVNFHSGNPLPAPYLLSADLPSLRSAGFQTCCIAGFQAGSPALWLAGLEIRDTADLEVCATLNSYPAPADPPCGRDGQKASPNHLSQPLPIKANQGC